MSILSCDNCSKRFDTDIVEMERIAVGDEDHITVCPACADDIQAEADAIMAQYQRKYETAPLSERNPAQYRRDLIDAGRGHLLRPEER